MSNGFGFNTNIFETNILNLAVVVRVVITVVGDAFRTLLDQRRQSVIEIIQDADNKIKAREQQLLDARRAVETARTYAQEIRMQALRTSEQERSAIGHQLQKELKRIQVGCDQVIQIEYQRTIKRITEQVTQSALCATEKVLLSAFDSTKTGRPLTKQKELNELHVSDTFRQLKGWSSIRRINHK